MRSGARWQRPGAAPRLTGSFPAAAADAVPQECHSDFTSRHLALVLDKCYSRDELDDYTLKDEAARGGHKMAKGLVPKCLGKDGQAFKVLERTASKPKAWRLTELSKCRPEGCKSAVDLFLWLVEVRLRPCAGCCCVG